MYMSYCRFEGTKMELSVCLSEVYDHINEEAEYEVSEDEIECFRDMVYSFVEFLQDAEILDEDGNVNEDALNDVCNAMRESYITEEY